MDKRIILMSLGLIAILASIVSSAPIPHGNFTYIPNSGGWMDIYNQGELFSRFGFAITGTIAGNPFIRSTANYTWTTQQVGPSLIARNNNAQANWTANFTIKPNNDLKIMHTLVNNAATIQNAKFWYIQTVNTSQSVTWNGTTYYMNQSRNLQGNYTDIVANINFFNGYAFNYDDLIADNFSITNIYVGDGSPIGFPNTWLLAIGVTKNNGSFPLGATAVLDPTVIVGCSETATAINCHSGSFSGNTIDTEKNISIYSSTVTTTQTDNPTCGSSAGEGYISLNSTGGWINISNSYVNANSTETSSANRCSSFHVINAPQGFIVETSTISVKGGNDACGGDDGQCATGGAGNMVINPSGNIILNGAILIARGGVGDGGDADDFPDGGQGDFNIYSPKLEFRDNPSTIDVAGGVAFDGGVIDAGVAQCDFNAENITTINTFANITCAGGDATGSSGTKNDGNSNLRFKSRYILFNGTILQTTFTEGNPDSVFEIKNTSFTDGKYTFRGGNLDSSGQDVETHEIFAQEFTLQDFSFKVGVDAGSIFNLTQDVVRLAQFGTARLVNPIAITTYIGTFGMIVVGNSTAGFTGLGPDFDTHSLSEYYAPLTNITFANNSMIAKSFTFTGNTIANITLANATLFVWNSTGALISSNTTQTLSGQRSAISIPHTFVQGQDAKNNYTVNFFVRDTDNQGSFMNRRGNRSLNVDFLPPNISLTNFIITHGSQTITFNLSAQGQQGCFYSIYRDTGQVAGLNNNVTITCGIINSATTDGFGQFYFYGYANDSVGNINQSIQNISIESLAGGPNQVNNPGGIRIIGQTVNWTVRTDTGQSSYEFLVSRGSNRTRAIQFINDAPSQVQIKLSCTGAYCGLVHFEQTEFSLPASTVNRVTEVDFTFAIPEDLETDVIQFNILATDQEENIAELPVRATVSKFAVLSEFFDKLFAKKRYAGLDIPNLIIGIFGASIAFGMLYFVALKGAIKTKGTRGFVAIFPSFVAFILIIIFIS